MVRCSDGTIYTGATDNIEVRITKHNDGRGARYTSGRRPVALLYSEEHPDRGGALKRETEIKRLNRARKESLAAGVSA